MSTRALLAVPAILLWSCFLPAPAAAQTKGSYDVFDYAAPRGWTVERAEQYLALKKDDGVRYGNVFLFRTRPSAGSPRADFEADWQSHARKHGSSKPADVATETESGWVATTGGGPARPAAP